MEAIRVLNPLELESQAVLSGPRLTLKSKLGSSERAPGTILTLHRETLRCKEASKRTGIDIGRPQNHSDIFLDIGT